jgi:hypothetical protein
MGTSVSPCLVADSPGAVYVACMGTKEARDLLADAAYLQTPLEVPTRTGAAAAAAAAGAGAMRGHQRLMVHRGFATRAKVQPRRYCRPHASVCRDQ